MGVVTRRFALPLLLAAALLCPRTAAEEEEPSPRPPPENEVLLAAIVSDPLGDASEVARRAAAAVRAEDWQAAYERFIELAEQHADVLIPTAALGDRRRLRADGALRWPAWRVANQGLARLPEAVRRQAQERWAPRVRTLRASAERGHLAALEAIAERYGVTPAGSSTLLLLASRDLEAGRTLRATNRLQEWLELNPNAPAASRAGVVVRLADTLATLEDAGALDRLQVLEQAVRTIPVSVGGAATTLGDRIAAWRAATAARESSYAAEAADAPPETPPLDGDSVSLLWSRSLLDPGYLRQGRGSPYRSVRAGVWGAGDTLVLHEGRVVRRLDVLTGRERWRFPDAQLVTIHDPRERYHDFDVPWRAVTPAGDSVLVVLGEPSATGRYTFLDQEYEADRLGRECRLRLACLDVATGALRWFTGAADDTHPVLGHRATGCASPPVVVGEYVYCLFARRLGATSFYLACLDRRTGTPHWVTALAAGESGRLDDQSSRRNRFTSPFAQSVPWGARPTRDGDEICCVPHAGFAAGVDADGGSVRWLRALPRYALASLLPAALGQNVSNAPLAWGDAWIVAPMDSPRMLCLARGSGDLRWQRGEASPDTPPGWRDLLGIGRDARGRPRVHLSGWQPLMMDPSDGALELPPHLATWLDEAGEPGGAALDLGTGVAGATEGALRFQSWDPPRAGEHVPPVELPRRGCPGAGDLYRIGDVWVVVGPKRIGAVAPGSAILGADLRSGGPAERGLLALTFSDPSGLADALAAVPTLPTETLRLRTYETLRDQLLRMVPALREEDDAVDALNALARAAHRLPPSLRGTPYRVIATALFSLDRDGDAARLLLRWLQEADDTLVPSGDRPAGTAIQLRGDLIAGGMLREHASRSGVQAALDEHEQASRKRLAPLLQGPEGALREGIRRAAGTHAADGARRALADRLVAQKRHAAAAAVTADRRLDPPWRSADDEPRIRIERAARLQMREAARLAEALEGDRARTLAADLERWAPGGMQDDEGRTQATLRAALRRRFGWYPPRHAVGEPFPAWREGRAVDRDSLRSVEFLGLQGPGADAVAADYVLLVRGITLEVWSLSQRKRLAVLPGGDEGWFGGSLTSVERWVPGGGIVVSSVVAQEPADGSGVTDGDWVRTWNGHEVTDLPAFMQLVAASRPGVEIPVGIWRGGKKVLDRFRTGRRPAAQGRLLSYAPLWVDGRGRVLVPGRTGLSHVDPRAGTRRSIWRWQTGGVVRRVDVFGGDAFVTVQRSLQPHVVVAVDPATGRERWRREVRGRVSRVQAVGSAIWIQTVAPEEAVIVDRHDGRLRASFRCFNRHRREFRKNWVADASAATASGRGFLVQGNDYVQAFLIVNTTTGGTDYTETFREVQLGTYGRFVNPQVSAGAFAAVVRSPGLRLYFPDPLGGPPRHALDLSANDLSSNQGNMGPLDDETRVFVKGRTIFTVRLPLQGRKQVTVAVFGVNYDGLRGQEPTDAGGKGNVIQMADYKTWLSGAPIPARYILSARAHFEGIFVCAARLTGEHQAEHYWIAANTEGAPEDYGHLRVFQGEVREARRHPPVRAGTRLFVPTDAGAWIYTVNPWR